MKVYKYMLLLILLAVVSCNSNSGDDKINDADTVIIDVRTQGEFDAGHVKNALLIPYDVIASKIAAEVPDKNQAIVVYCRSGRRSGIAKASLEAEGYTNVTNGGGFNQMIDDGYQWVAP